MHDFFNSFFEQVELIDIEPPVLSPTWNNGQVGSDGISKRLDRFFMEEYLCDSLGRYITWNVSTGFSNHRAVVLELDKEKSQLDYPLKFNKVWLEDISFCSLVK